MIWLTWRQHRRQALFAAIGLAALAALIIPTGRSMRDDFVKGGLAACLKSADGDCIPLADVFSNKYSQLATLSMLLVFVPLMVGLFWGAPLVARELEHGTHRLVWTQGVSRLRWASVKFGSIIAATVLIATVYAGLVSWWLEPLNQAGRGRLSELSFDVQGVVPVAYTLFAVALGICAGTVWRRVLPAMAAVVVGFLGLRFAVLLQPRGHFQPTSERTFPVIGGDRPGRPLGEWTFDSGIKNASGEVVRSGEQIQCGLPVADDPNGPCMAFPPGSYNFQLYQPDSHFWPIQFIEAGLFTALALLLVGVAVWRIRARVT
ncbi:MAG TPA: hypothetical protein VF482_00575 [Trebonia sp.]